MGTSVHVIASTSAALVAEGAKPQCSRSVPVVFFFFQAEDGIRDLTVTGVQTCALPIFREVVLDVAELKDVLPEHAYRTVTHVVIDDEEGYLRQVQVEDREGLYRRHPDQIGRASCRERV